MLKCSRCKSSKYPSIILIFEHPPTGDHEAVCKGCLMTEDLNADWDLLAQIDFYENGAFHLHKKDST